MDYTKLSGWLHVVANFGILLGLIFGGIQLKQNSDLLKTQLLYEESYRAIEIETQVVGENAAAVWAKSITDAKSLTLEEQRIMEAILWSFVEQLRASRMLSELGLLGDNEWQARVESDTAYYLANDYGRAWWANFGDENSPLPADLRSAIDKRLSEAGDDFTLDYSRAIMGLVNER